MSRIPPARQKFKSAKPVVKTVKRWTTESKLELQACFDCTDWSVFVAAATDLDELTDTVTCYTRFCEDMCVPTKTFCTYNNKPWFTAKLRLLRQAKEEAYRSGDRVLYNTTRNSLTKEIKVAKRCYTEKLKNRFSANKPASVWRGLQELTNYRRPSPHIAANRELADDLNVFYCRFEKPTFTPITRSNIKQPSSPPAPPSPLPPDPPPSLRICEEDMCQLFRKQKSRKAPGTD
ncbi:RNA-directed DNA polymerase from transposon BS, partial [Solea senegalensis]